MEPIEPKFLLLKYCTGCLYHKEGLGGDLGPNPKEHEPAPATSEESAFEDWGVCPRCDKTPRPKTTRGGKGLFGSYFHIVVHH